VAGIEAALALGRTDRAEEFLAAIERQPPGLRTPLMAAQARRFRGRMSGSEADFAAAERQLRDLGIPFWLAVTQLEHAESLLVNGGREEAQMLLDEARPTFAELRAAPWLERVTRLEGRELQAEPAS
jgi:hypothetical protein